MKPLPRQLLAVPLLLQGLALDWQHGMQVCVSDAILKPKHPHKPNANTITGGLLSVNFAPELLSMSAEVVQWERLRFAVRLYCLQPSCSRQPNCGQQQHSLLPALPLT